MDVYQHRCRRVHVLDSLAFVCSFIPELQGISGIAKRDLKNRNPVDLCVSITHGKCAGVADLQERENLPNTDSPAHENARCAGIDVESNLTDSSSLECRPPLRARHFNTCADPSSMDGHTGPVLQKHTSLHHPPVRNSIHLHHSAKNREFGKWPSSRTDRFRKRAGRECRALRVRYETMGL